MNALMDVLIVDDEQLVRDGLCSIIDWEKLGFRICAEAADGEEALDRIRNYQPDLVLLDVKLPGLMGTEVLKTARSFGFDGEVIILSGYSDFEYAKRAMEAGASAYLVKPVDEIELQSTVLAVRERIREKGVQRRRIDQAIAQTREKILTELINESGYNPLIDYYSMGFVSSRYQVIIYENYHEGAPAIDFAELLAGSRSREDTSGVTRIRIERHNVILLEGSAAIERFNRWIEHLMKGNAERYSYLDSVFFVYGEVVSHVSEIRKSYLQCLNLIKRRFYCAENQHMLSWRDLDNLWEMHELPETFSIELSCRLYEAIRKKSAVILEEELEKLHAELLRNNYADLLVRHLFIDILLQIKHRALLDLGDENRSRFTTNTELIEQIEGMDYLYEIERYLFLECRKIMDVVGAPTSQSIMDDVLAYIDNNIQSKLTLESIAPVFGYNSSYFGKLFTVRTGYSFNSYLEKVRIEKAKLLLVQSDERIQDIAAKVGYRYIDMFNKKFRKLTGCSPSEYRRNNKHDHS